MNDMGMNASNGLNLKPGRFVKTTPNKVALTPGGSTSVLFPESPAVTSLLLSEVSKEEENLEEWSEEEETEKGEEGEEEGEEGEESGDKEKRGILKAPKVGKNPTSGVGSGEMGILDADDSILNKNGKRKKKAEQNGGSGEKECIGCVTPPKKRAKKVSIHANGVSASQIETPQAVNPTQSGPIGDVSHSLSGGVTNGTSNSNKCPNCQALQKCIKNLLKTVESFVTPG